ncbi:MAG TPA: acetate/propionate family kinase [Rhodocyclaceae bacterium]|nr:acetate/propionate family kinase [Rhodocyclaceae bacterium]
MSDALLVLNAGSSSIKFALFPLAATIARRPALSGQIDGIGAGQGAALTAVDGTGAPLADQPLADCAQHHQAIAFLFQWLDRHGAHDVAAVGHRVVHGGEHYHEPILIDDAKLEALAKLIPLAPLHQPHNLEAIRALRRLKPGLPQVACFDTAFHRSQPLLAQAFALPREISAQGIRRYGFHGLSYEYIAAVLPEHLGDAACGRVVVAHLGNGASMCAMRERKSVATTMGFTALDGLMMGTRCGNLDPGVLLYLMEQQGMDCRALTRLLYHQSGLLGVSGISQDMRELLASDQAEAKEAVDLFCYRITRELGSLAAALNGLDALVFTGGIGEHAAPVRAQVCADARWLGVEIDAAANSAGAMRISAAGSGIAVLVLPTNEEWIIARHTARRIQ